MYINKFDIQKLQDLPIEQVAEALQLSVSRHKAICPFHDDTHASLTFHVGRNRYRCFVCDSHGGSIDLVMHSQGWSFSDSCQWLANKFGILLSDSRDYTPKQLKQQVVKVLSPREESSASVDVPYLTRLMAQPILNEQARQFLFNQRCLSPEVIQQLGLSSISYNCPMSASPKPTYFDGPALLIPYRDIDGHLLSVQSRYLGNCERPRFRFPKGSQCHIYNLPVLKTLTSGEPLFITEGCTDCWSILSAGYKAIAIPSATLLKPSDLETLRNLHSELGTTFHMFPDNDLPGERLFFQLQDALRSLSLSLTRHPLPSDCKDLSEHYVRHLSHPSLTVNR